MASVGHARCFDTQTIGTSLSEHIPQEYSWSKKEQYRWPQPRWTHSEPAVEDHVVRHLLLYFGTTGTEGGLEELSREYWEANDLGDELEERRQEPGLDLGLDCSKLEPLMG